MPGTIQELQGKGSRLRHPQWYVELNGSDVLTGVEEVEVTNASHFSADTFRVVVAIDKLPFGLGIDYWSSSQYDELEIFASFNDPGLTTPKSLIYGQIDEVEIDLVTQSMTLSGRDLSAQFLDTKTAEHFQEQTASQVVKKIAARHGLLANVASTTTKVGLYYEQMNVGLTKDQSEWDLLSFLAQQEEYDLWMSGRTLHFQPPVPLTADPYVLLWSDLGQGNRVANFETLSLHRSQTLAKDVKVTVKSFNQAQKKTVVTKASRVGANKNQRVGGAAQEFTFYPPNLNKQQADKYAQAKLADITRHERVITGSLPGDNLLTNRSLIKLVGTGTDWDQLYFLDSVTRHLSVSEGYRMNFRAKNHSTRSTV